MVAQVMSVRDGSEGRDMHDDSREARDHVTFSVDIDTCCNL